MATYYVRTTGSDAAAGTSPATAWLTIGKALGAAGISSGDTVYIGAGTYREIVTVAMTSATAETKVVGDVTGANTGDAGEVIWTAHVTDDVTAPVSAYPLVLSGRDYLTFENLIFYQGTTGCVNGTTTTSTNCKFYRCSFLGYTYTTGLSMTCAADTALALIVDACEFWMGGSGGTSGLNITLATSASADYDSDCVIKNCLFVTGNIAITVTSSGAASFKGGGVDVFNCYIIANTCCRTATANISTTYPVNVYNCLLAGSIGLSANTSGHIIEDYNIFTCGGPRTNVSSGTNSKATLYAPGWTGIRPMTQGLVPCRPFAEPCLNSKMLGFGAQAGGPTVDITGATRPSGGASTSYAVGAYERGNFGTKETSVTHAGAAALKLTGPGYQDFQVPVDASSTTVTVYGRYDTNHAATNKPQIQVLNGTGIGVADATATMTVGVDTWEAVALTFTPTAKGIVTIRCISRSAAGNGIAYFDS